MPDFEPLYTSDEMRAAEAGHDTSELMERAGAGAAEHALQIYSGAERWTVVCGGGANGGAALRANETVPFHRHKVGLVVAPGRFNAGTVHVVDIGLEPGETGAQLATG